MRLVPLSGAPSVTDVIELAKSDPDGAQVLAGIAMYEALHAQIDDVRPALTTDVAKAIAASNAVMRTRLLAKHAGGRLEGRSSPDDQVAAYVIAGTDSVVDKALRVGDLAMFNRQHPRDARGRFVSVQVGRNSGSLGVRTERVKAHAYEARAQMDTWGRSGLVDASTPIAYTVQRLSRGNRLSPKINERTASVKDLNAELQRHIDDPGSHTHVITEMGLRPGTGLDSERTQAAFDLAGLATGHDSGAAARMAHNLVDPRGNMTFNGDQAAANWYGQTQGTDRQSYRRIGMTGSALAAATAPGTLPNAIGHLGALAGALGPEAEKVIGPGIRRTAYRYRGTERAPDEDLNRALFSANVMAEGLSGTASEQQRTALDNANAARGSADPTLRVAAAYKSPSITDDQRSLGIRGDVGVAYLLGAYGQPSALPTKEETEISLESGEMPPSQGVLIDDRGRIAAQAVGYNGDHYVPFNLRNLKSLHAGQYVRTRATGGLTGEDIYTGLMSGARQMQVVSRSGVFTLEFDPSLRGGRRMNDKARRMVERYSSMLEAISRNDNKIFERDLTREQKAEVSERVMAERPATRKAYTDLYDKEIERMRWTSASNAEFEEEDLEEAADNAGRTAVRQAREQDARINQKDVRDIYNQAAAEFRAKNPLQGVKALRLDAEGYGRALKALQREFPYYVRRADAMPLRDWMGLRGLSQRDTLAPKTSPADVGYVEPGQTNTSGTRERGFRAARLVPTNAGTAATAAAANTGGGGSNTVTTDTDTPAAPGAAAPAAAATPLGSPKALKPAAQAAGEGGVFAGTVAQVGPKFTNMANTGWKAYAENIVMPEESAPGDTWLNWNSNAFAQLYGAVKKAREDNQTGPDAVPKWYAATTDENRKIVDEALVAATNEIDRVTNDIQALGMPKAAATKIVTEMRTMLDLYRPTVPLPADLPNGAPGDPVRTPAAFPEVPPYTATDEEFAAAKAKLSRMYGEAFDEGLKMQAPMAPEGRMGHMFDLRREIADTEADDPVRPGMLREYAAHNTARSLAHAQALAKEYRKMSGAEQAPKASGGQPPSPAPSSQPASQLGFRSQQRPPEEEAAKADTALVPFAALVAQHLEASGPR